MSAVIDTVKCAKDADEVSLPFEFSDGEMAEVLDGLGVKLVML